MKKNILYAILLVVFIGAAGFVVLRFRSNETRKQQVMYTLLERKGIQASAPEWANTKEQAQKLSANLKAHPGDTKTMVALANLFIMEARATGNYQYYDQAAMKYVNEALQIEPANFNALTLKSLLYLSQHHFADGLAIAQEAVKTNPYNAFIYGVLVDGYVEMGHYDSAVVSAEKMMSIRPDLRSYARASYLREIYGDYPGAIEAMKLAIDAGMPGDESTEWSRVQLGHLYEHTGDLNNAEQCYALALASRPGYSHALAGMGRVAMAKQDYPRAINWFQQADSLSYDLSAREELVDAYELSGQKEKARAIAELVIESMNKNAVAAARDENIGHYADKELAYAYLKINNYDTHLEHALAEYNRRPNNIDVNETVAWVYYQRGEYAKALPYINKALKTGSRNPVLLCRAGMIYDKTGDKVKAKMYLEQGLANNAFLPGMLKASGEQLLKEI